MSKRGPFTPSIDAAHEHCLRGTDLEADDVSAATAAYAACLEGECADLHARINLGRLLHLAGRYELAELVYRDTRQPDAVLFFNLGVLLEDQDKRGEAMVAHREALVHDSGMADDYFNLALLLGRQGEAQAAFRHLLAYRRLSRLLGSTEN